MTHALSTFAAEHPCPACGYDLRASKEQQAEKVRCPECGKMFDLPLAASRIPWVHRKYIGRIRAYRRTLTMVCWHASRLARAVDDREGPTGRKAARRFYWINVAVATVMGVALLKLALEPTDGFVSFLVNKIESTSFWWPALALVDRWYEWVPLVLSVFLAVRACLGFYRWAMTVGERSPFRRRRLETVSAYFSGIAMPLTVMFGLVCAFLRVRIETDPPDRRWLDLIIAVILIFAFAQYAITTAGFLIAGRKKILRGIAMLVLFPPLGLALGVGIIVAIHWEFGFTSAALTSIYR